MNCRNIDMLKNERLQIFFIFRPFLKLVNKNKLHNINGSSQLLRLTLVEKFPKWNPELAL